MIIMYAYPAIPSSYRCPLSVPMALAVVLPKQEASVLGVSVQIN